MRIAWKSVPVFVKGIVIMIGNLFTGVLTKILLAATLLCGSVACVSVYLYLGTRDELVELEARQIELKQALKECSEGKDKVVEGAKQDDSINMDKEEELTALKGEKDVLLSKLDKLSRTKCRTPSPAATEIMYETINIGDSWDADVQQLLDNTYRSNKRDSNPTP